MDWLKQRVLAGEQLIGAGAMLGSPMIAELIARAGFDWIWIDYEHGIGDIRDLLTMIQASQLHKVPAIIRLPANELRLFKQALDFGAAGTMVPYVNTKEQAAHAARSSRYPPDGDRGVATSTRASMFGLDFDTYKKEANENVLTVVQIETVEAIDNVEAIAATDGVDVLFVGPLDLSVSMGMVREFTNPTYEAALDKVLAACAKYKKMPGILTPTPQLAEAWAAKGFKFLVVGSDGSMLARAFDDLRKKWPRLQK